MLHPLFSGGGVGGVHASIYAFGDRSKGIELNLQEDASWALIAEPRAGVIPGSAAVSASGVFYANGVDRTQVLDSRLMDLK